MKVGVDATSWANRRGYGRFARNVVSRLVTGEDEYVLFTDERTAREEELPQEAHHSRGCGRPAARGGRPSLAPRPRARRAGRLA